jgi:hypothetical protein
MRTVVVALAGFGLLLAFVPAWATVEVSLFGGVFGALVWALDEEVKDVMRRMLGSRLRGNDTDTQNDVTKAGAKSPAERRAAI